MTALTLAPLGSQRGQTLDPELAHDQRNGVVSDLDGAAMLELGSDSERPVGATGGLVDVGDLTGQPDPPERSR